MTKQEKSNELAEKIVEAVGGKDNIFYFTHCITRLRFNLKDKGVIDSEGIKKLSGVLGFQWAGEQFQIVIGQNVGTIYSIICHNTGLEEQAAIDENLDGISDKKEKLTIKNMGSNIISYLSGSMTGVIPVLIAAAMCKTLGSLLGPDVLNVISDTSDLYMLFDFLFDAFFYFLPIFLGYSAAKVLKTDTLLGIYIGALIIVPDFVALVGTRDTFSVFGIPAPVAGYGQTFLPIILGVWVMSYVYRFFKKIVPDILTLWVTPLLTILVMTPVMFVICAPLGSYVGNLISQFLMAMGASNQVVRIIGAVILGALYPYLTLFGMHSTAYMVAYVTYFDQGYESFLMPNGYIFGFAIMGTALAAAIRYKKKENKSLALGYFISGVLGGITEPTLYGVCLKNKSSMKVLMISCGIGGLLSGILSAGIYVPVMGTIFTASAIWTGGSTANIVKGLILEAVSFLAAFLGTLKFTNLEEA